MSANPKVIGRTKGNSALEWPVFRPGQLLRDDHLQLGIDYTRELSRLLFRSLFGCGVVCGLEVAAREHCDRIEVTVQPGVALDCDGDPVHVPEKRTVTIDPACDFSSTAPSLWIVLRGKSKCCPPQAAACPCEDEEPPECTRERDGYEIGIYDQRPGCVCGCPETRAKVEPNDCRCVDPTLECYRDHYAGKCQCGCAGCDDCACEWILLARVDRPTGEEKAWKTEHLVRRFVRPVLMRDPALEPPTASVEAAPQPPQAKAPQPAQKVSRGVKGG